VLTVASLVKDAAITHFVIGENAGEPTEICDVGSAHLHEAYDAATGAFDVAILSLDQPAKTPPLALLQSHESTLGAGTPITVIGCGVTDPPIGGYGMRRRGSGIITTILPGAFEFSVNPAQIAAGDVGGPAIVQTQFGPRVAGVNNSNSAVDQCVHVSAVVGSALGHVLALLPAIASVTTEPRRPVSGYPMQVMVQFTYAAEAPTNVELSLLSLQEAPEISVPIGSVVVDAGSDHAGVAIHGVVRGGRVYTIEAKTTNSTMQSDSFTPYSHATLAAITVEPVNVSPNSQFNLAATLAAPLAEAIIVPVDVTFPNGDVTTIGIPIQAQTTHGMVSPTIGPALGEVTFAAGLSDKLLTATLTVS
jgi:hypothetical protein